MKKIYAFIDEYVSEDGKLGQRLARFGDGKHIWIKFETEKYTPIFREFLKKTSELFTTYQKFDPIVLTGDIIKEDDSNIFMDIIGWEIGDFTDIASKNIVKPLLHEKDFNQIIENMGKWLSFVEIEQKVMLINDKYVLAKHEYKNFKNTSIYQMQGLFSLWRLNVRLKYPLKGEKKWNIAFIN